MESMTPSKNRRIVLAARPIGAPTASNFRLETQAVPVPAQGQMLLRTVYLSLDPYMRGRMQDGPSYAEPVAVGNVMVGGTVCRVEASLHADFAVGDLVLASSGWQEYIVTDGAGITGTPTPIDRVPTHVHSSRGDRGPLRSGNASRVAGLAWYTLSCRNDECLVCETD